MIIETPKILFLQTVSSTKTCSLSKHDAGHCPFSLSDFTPAFYFPIDRLPYSTYVLQKEDTRYQGKQNDPKRYQFQKDTYFQFQKILLDDPKTE